MQAPIPAGKVLRKQYLIKKVLGQGGFGRTYLAEDLTRFKEACVIKEYIPQVDKDTSILDKSKELFKREAQVLYKIKHSQIPQFRGAFMAGKRLFLVQDFVEGETYSSLLEKRKLQGETFSQREMVQFLQQMLPILHYIHQQGLVHRDISPDNIILRHGDELPVLIDFGVVKEQVAQLEASSNSLQQATTVGKVGYSPNEQLQTGQVFPNSDLYALAVTSVVLMTGKKPQELFDQHTMTWRWQQWIPTLNFRFATILNRMMSARPNQRYQSATEVAQALRAIAELVTDDATKLQPQTTANGTETREQQIQPTQLSANTTTSAPTALRATPRHSRQTRNLGSTTSTTASPKKRGGNTTLTILAAGGGAIFLLIAIFSALVQSLLNSEAVNLASRDQSTEVRLPPYDSGVYRPQPARMPPGPRPKPGMRSQVSLRPGETVNEEGILGKGERDVYAIGVQKGQRLNVAVAKGEVKLSIFRAGEDKPVSASAAKTRVWQGLLDNGGMYTIHVDIADGVAESDYELEIGLQDAL